MGYQPRIKSPRGSIHDYRKSLRERSRDKKQIHRRLGKQDKEEKHITTEREISELTLKRLHTLGKQKFGSSPYSEHFDRWLTNVAAVLSEFESYPNMGIDSQFVIDRSQALSDIKHQFENRRYREASLNQEIRNLSDQQSRLEQVNTEYVSKTSALRGRKNSEIKRLNGIINSLKSEQEKIIQMKTGFFHGVSKKEREQREIVIADKLSDKQRELELVLLDFSSRQKRIRIEFETKREPIFDQIKVFQKRAQNLEEDGSLEERWFACEALIDAVNTFLQRKADLTYNPPKP